MQQNLPLYLGQRFNSLIWSCIDSQLTRSALFFAERYYSLDRNNHDARHLYATALLRENQVHSALHIVNLPADTICTGCLEIKAQCLTSLGRYRQARNALEAAARDPNYVPTSSMGPRTSQSWPETAALHCRAGTAAWKGHLPEKAAASFKRALAQNPFLWEAFEGLCALGITPDINTLLPPRLPPIRSEDKNELGPIPTGNGFFTPEIPQPQFGVRGGIPQPFRINPLSGSRDSIGTTFFADTPLNPNHRHTNIQLVPPSPIPHLPLARPLSSADEIGPAMKKPRWQMDSLKPPAKKSEEPAKKVRQRGGPTSNNHSSSGAQPQARTSKPPSTNTTTQANPPPATRRSSRLQNTNAKPPPPVKKRVVSRDRRRQLAKARSRSADSDAEDEAPSNPSPSASSTPRSDGSSGPGGTAHHAQELYETELADNYIYDIMRHFAIATRHLARYECHQCLDELGSLPHVHQQSAWALSMAGKAHFEKLDYPSAERAFKALREVEPYRLWDMEVFSTLLWHLQRSVELSFLAQELVNINPHSPQAWIAVGNLFSLQKERAQALTCFERAYELDSLCAYAYTLSGHECIDEDLNKAMVHFQEALRADARHYNAWYGLGTCYLRQSKLRLAEYHYKKAADIHPTNAVLLGCIGMTLEKRGDQTTALRLFSRAIELTPSNALVRYRRAKLLMSQKRYREAIEDLETLRSNSPEEANVIFQLAKVYRLVGDETKSAQLLAAARDISPKSVEKIKKLLATVKETGTVDRMDQN